MYLCYIDESGNTGTNLDSTEQPIHWLVGLVATPGAVRDIEREMLGIARSLFPMRARAPGFEFHGSQIYAGRGAFRDINATERVRLYGDLMSLIEEHSCTLFVRGIHKAKHKLRAEQHGYRPHHPHKVAFMFLVEAVDRWLEDLQPQGDLIESDGQPVYGMIVTDEQHEVDRELVERFAYWRDSGTDFGYRQREIRYLIDTVHRVPSHDSWLIQLVDCVAYLRHRLHRAIHRPGAFPNNLTRAEEAVRRIWSDHCSGAVQHDVVWPW